MNPILLYPQNASQERFIREIAEQKGIAMPPISEHILEELDDMLFAERMIANRSGKLVSFDELKKVFTSLQEEE